MTDPIRVLRLDAVSAARSQAVYHALGHAAPAPATAPVDTVLLVTPAQRYVSIGYHQELEREVDTEACRRLGLPVIRREVGGGAVLLDDGQTFVHWVFGSRRLPVVLEDRFRLFAEPMLRTYGDLGIPARFRPVNDIQVDGRKIGGTGAARMADAEVVVGSLMFDFDHDTMAQVLRVSSVKMRDKVAEALREYVTSMRRELGEAPPREQVLDAYLAHLAAVLERPVERGALTAGEDAAVRSWEDRLLDDAWMARKTSRIAPGVKISSSVSVHEAEHKAPGGLVRATLTVESGSIVHAVLSGDFTVLPSSAVESLEGKLVGCPATSDAVTPVVTEWLAGVEAPGVSVGDVVQALDLRPA